MLLQGKLRNLFCQPLTASSPDCRQWGYSHQTGKPLCCDDITVPCGPATPTPPPAPTPKPAPTPAAPTPAPPAPTPAPGPRSLPQGNLLVGYAYICEQKVVAQVEAGTNVIVWFSSDLVKDAATGRARVQTHRGGEPQPLNMTCVAEVAQTLRERNLPVTHLISIGGWNGERARDIIFLLRDEVLDSVAPDTSPPGFCLAFLAFSMVLDEVLPPASFSLEALSATSASTGVGLLRLTFFWLGFGTSSVGPLLSNASGTGDLPVP